MSAQGLEVIDHTVDLTHEWINELTGRLGWTSRRGALRLLRVVLHQVRDRLSTDELAQFSAQMPLLIRGMLFEGWVPKRTPVKERSLDAFERDIAAEMTGNSEYRGEDDIRCVFDLLNHRISDGEIMDIRHALPERIRRLWWAP